MPTSSARRAAALAAVTVTALLAVSACSDSGSDGGGGSGSSDPTAGPKNLATQKLDWKACAARPSSRVADPHRRRCPAESAGSARS